MRLPESLITWNVGPRRPWQITRSLRRLIRDEQPDALALFEAHRALPRIRRKFAKRYNIWATDDVVLLVRKDCEPPDVKPAGHLVEWWGPKEGLEHEGREHLIATWGKTMRWTLMHGTPGGPLGGVGPHLSRPGQTYGRNRPAWAADGRVVRPSVRDFPGASLVAGDLNATAEELAERFAEMGVRNIITNANVDHAAQRLLDADATRLDNYRSDHPAIRIDMRPRLRDAA